MQQESPLKLSENPWIGRIAFLLAMAYSAGVLIWLHDRTWWPPDEGVFAHVAERVLEGEVLNRDVQNVHPGYIVFANSAALYVFGKDLLSLRYPIVFLTFLSCAILFLVGAKRGILSGFVAAICVASLSVVHFLNPTPHWYCFFLITVTIAALTKLPRGTTGRIELVGFLVTTIFLFRQLTGVLAAIGVLSYLLNEMQPEERKSNAWCSRGLYFVMFVGLLGYFYISSDPFSFISCAVWPLAILLLGMVNTRVENREVVRLVGRLSVSVAVGLLPILSYHIYFGSLGEWFDDTFVRAFLIADLEFISQPSHSRLFFGGALRMSSASTIAEFLNGIFWMILPILPTILGILVVRSLIVRDHLGAAALPYLSVFYAVVSMHFQTPIYLFFTIAFTSASLLWMTSKSRIGNSVTAIALLGCCAIAMIYHAGQPLVRYENEAQVGREIMNGEKFALVPAELPHATLQIEPSTRELYRWLLGIADRESEPDDSIFALPMNSELYFLTGRRNPYRIYCTSIGISNDRQLKAILDELKEKPPRLVFFRSTDKYNSKISRRIMEDIRARYVPLERRFGFEVYRWKETERNHSPENPF